jgi:hypothetical protein
MSTSIAQEISAYTLPADIERSPSPSTASVSSFYSCVDYAIHQDPTTPSTRTYTRDIHGDSLEILTIGTQNQFNISISKFTDSNRQIQSRLVVEDPRINLKDTMQISDEDIMMLSEATPAELSHWASSRDLVITKVDYLSKEIFRTDAYTLFMCDVEQDAREAIEAKIQKTDPFTEEELTTYTQDAWWDVIDAYAHKDPDFYDAICYKALGALQNKKIDLDSAAAILNYCGVKRQNPEVERYVAKGCDTHLRAFMRTINQDQVYTEEVLKTWEASIDKSLDSIPVKNKIVLYTNSDSKEPVILHINQLFLTFIHGSMVTRPAAGMSHRNRFGSAAERISSTYVPTLNHPQKIHERSCDNSLLVTAHDQIHLAIEATNPSREAWISFATYMHAKIEDAELKEATYNLMLDRALFSDNAVDNFIFLLPQLNIPVYVMNQLVSLGTQWMKEHAELFNLPAFHDTFRPSPDS